MPALGEGEAYGNALDGGWRIYGVVGYSRLLGDAADTPFMSVRGSPNQFITGLGVGHKFSSRRRSAGRQPLDTPAESL